MLYKLETIETFDAAHYLPNYDGKCKNLHGHSWKIKVRCESETLNKDGFVVDFSALKKIIREFDHTLLNTFIANPTAENIARYFYERIPNCKSITVWETEHNKVTYEP